MSDNQAAPLEGEGQIATTTLDNGTAVILRPVSLDDSDRITDGFERCSAGTRYFRFMSGGYRLTEERLAELTEANQRDHVVWLAIDAGKPSTPVMGLARFVRLADVPDQAEVAFIVADEYQGQGVGGLLFDALRVAAGVNGVSTFLAEVLGENTPMITLLVHRGAKAKARDRYSLTLELAIEDVEVRRLVPLVEGALQAMAEAAAEQATSN